MSDAYQEIQHIPMLQVLDKLGLHYTREWSDYVILKDGKLTRRKVNMAENYVNDFSHDRPKWWPWAFVKYYLRLQNKEVFEWYDTHFGITGDYKSPRRTKKLYRPKITYTQPFNS